MLQIKKPYILILLVKVFGSVHLFVQAEPPLQTALTNRSSRNVCPQGYYGPNCKETCNAMCSQCDNRGNCLQCSRLGVQLPECTQACKRGFFGSNCRRRCEDSCLNAECDPKTGYCLACRDAGYSLPTCTLPCLSGTYGLHCKGQCPLPCKDDCDPLSGTCTQCDIGEGPHCTINCALVKNRENCSVHCPERCVGWCNTAHRKCSMCSPGFKEPHCREYCDTGTFGSQCNQNCSFRCKHNQCDHVTGECMGCIDGYVGRWCNGKCVEGLYGPECAMSCPETCLGKFCHAESGFCVKCLTGYTGHLCDRLCERGRHGTGCSTPCPTKCRWPCDPVTGECPDCLAGYYGKTCNSICPTGSYGLNCNRTCPIGCLNEICNHETGNCVHCKEYFHGPRCKLFARKETQSFEIVIYSVISLLTPVLLLGIIIAFYKYRSTRENKSILEKVVGAEKDHFSRQMQKTGHKSRITKSEIRVLSNQNVESLLRDDKRLQGNLKLKPNSPRPKSGLKQQSTSITSRENSIIQTSTNIGTSESKVLVSRPNPTERASTKTPKADNLSIPFGREQPKHDHLLSSENQKVGKPVKVSYSKESKLDRVPNEQEYTVGEKSFSEFIMPQGTNSANASLPLSGASERSMVLSPQNVVDLKTKAEISQASVQIDQSEKQHPLARPNSMVQTPIYTQRAILPANEDFWRQTASNPKLSSYNSKLEPNEYFSASALARFSNKKLDQQIPERVSPVLFYSNKPKSFPVASSPSRANKSHIPILSKDISSSQVAQISHPQSSSKQQSSQSSSLHGKLQARPEYTPSLPSETYLQPFTSSSHNTPPLNQDMVSHSQTIQSQSGTTHPQQSRQGSLSSSVSLQQSRPNGQTEHDPILQNKISSLQHSVSRSQSLSKSALAQTGLQAQRSTSPPRLNMPEEKQAFPLQQQDTSRSQLGSASYNVPQRQYTSSSALKYMSQSEHTVPSLSKPSFPVLHSTLSQPGKSQLISMEQHTASRPQSGSSIRQNNTLSSLSTIPLTSESWSGQQRSRSNFQPQGKSVTLTNISSNDTSESGHDKHLQSASASGLPETQNIEESERMAPGLEVATGTGSNAWQPNNFTFNFTRLKGSGSEDEGKPALNNTMVKTEPRDDMHPQTTERWAEFNKVVPNSAKETDNSASSSRRKTRQVRKDSAESTKQKRPESKSPGLVRCATTRRQVQSVPPESRPAEPSRNPLPTPPAQGRAILKPVHKASRRRAEQGSKSSSSRDLRENSQSQSD